MPTDSQDLQSLPWMSCRIPVRDALAAFVPRDSTDFAPPRPVYETRWYPRPDGYRVLIPHDGGPFDANIFHIEPGAWDHVTCNSCNVRIKAMTPCYVTRHGAFLVLCTTCHEREVVGKLPFVQAIVLRLKRLFGRRMAA
ncbi:MAG TPA: hypothetical protein VK660_02505 [Xanthomonadaceae bacterium]|jgi:hypothetical protein|nr:hypothetical protein [Xanthomonadaceae bacterium]